MGPHSQDDTVPVSGQPLTKKALFDHTLQEMRRCGEPLEYMSQKAPISTPSSSHFEFRQALIREYRKAQGKGTAWTTPSELRARMDADLSSPSASEKKRRLEEEERELIRRKLFLKEEWSVSQTEDLPRHIWPPGNNTPLPPLNTLPNNIPPPSSSATEERPNSAGCSIPALSFTSDPGPGRRDRFHEYPAVSFIDDIRSNKLQQGMSKFTRMWQEAFNLEGLQDTGDLRRGAFGLSAEARNDSKSEWNHSEELGRLRLDMLETARFRPEKREISKTFDLAVFEDDEENEREDIKSETSVPKSTKATLQIPPNFPPYRIVDGAIELSTYLASSNYIVSLGGSPVPDLKYGIIIVPSGEEELLFNGYGDHAALPNDLKEEIYTKSKAMNKQEFKDKVENEIANGVPSTPDLDDDDREFYRRRWLARKGIVESPTQPIDAQAVQAESKSKADCKSSTANENASQSYKTTSERRSINMTRPPTNTPGNTVRSPPPTFYRSTPNTDSNTNSNSPPSTRLQEAPPTNKHRIPSIRSRAFSPSSHPSSSRSSCSSSNEPPPPTLSPSALKILELVLEGEKNDDGQKTKRTHLRALLPTKNRRKQQQQRSPSPAADADTRRAVLLEVSRAMARLAMGEMRENPGVDGRVWEGARRELELGDGGGGGGGGGNGRRY